MIGENNKGNQSSDDTGMGDCSTSGRSTEAHSSHLPEAKDVSDELKNLKIVCTKCIELNHDIRVLKAEVATYKERCAELQGERDTYLKQINDQISQLPRIFKSHTGEKDTQLSTLTHAVDQEEEFKDFVVAEDKIYIGSGKTLARKDVMDVEPYATVGKRLKEICLLMWPDGLHRHALQVNKSLRISNVTAVADQEIKAIKGILAAMAWPSKFNITEKDIRDKFKHILSSARTAFLTANPSLQSVANQRKKCKGGQSGSSACGATDTSGNEVENNNATKGDNEDSSCKSTLNDSMDMLDQIQENPDYDTSHHHTEIDERHLSECDEEVETYDILS